MRLDRSRRSTNVVDARGRGRTAGVGLGGLLILLVGAFFGLDLSGVVGLTGGGATQSVETTQGQATDAGNVFLEATLGDTEQVWGELFARSGADYPEPVLVRFSGAVQSACGAAQSSTGPFYCPADQRLYMDLSFFQDLARMGGAGDFAAAYVIAHEVGHHVQNVQGILGEVQQRQRLLPEAQANALSVRVELQADCYAGVWAHHAQAQRGILEEGDVEEGLAAAAAVGDDRLQRAAGQAAVPETFTHGTSAQRQEWFVRGLRSGDPQACNTFG